MDRSDNLLKGLIWLYFLLLLFEGALRKWVVPSLSAPLLIIRDPIVVAIYIAAASRGKFPSSLFVGWAILLAILSFAASFAGLGNLKVTLFGLRANFLHLPLIFVVPQVFDAKDVKRIGWFLLLTAPFMAMIAVQQFRTGPFSWWNAAAGGELGGQLGTAQNKVRASGTFSFVNGLVAYLSCLAAFVLYHFMNRQYYGRILGWTALCGTVLMLGVSGSRGAIVAVTVVCATVIFICVRQPGKFGKALRPAVMAIFAVMLLTYVLPVFSEGIAVQRDRFIGGGGIKHGIFMRYLNEFPAAIMTAFNVPLFGYGLGVGTNAGAGLLIGRRTFLLSESEWSRLVMESGAILGLGYILLRVSIAVYALLVANRALGRGSILSMLLVGASFLDMVAGQFGQPTAMGFAVFGCALALAAARDEEASDSAPAAEPEALSGATVVRGRSQYAERLHRGRT